MTSIFCKMAYIMPTKTHTRRWIKGRTKLGFVVTFSLTLVLPLGVESSHADSATWLANPASRYWNTAANWMPNTVPNGPADTARFGVSTITAISVLDFIEVKSIEFDAGASASASHPSPRGLSPFLL